ARPWRAAPSASCAASASSRRSARTGAVHSTARRATNSTSPAARTPCRCSTRPASSRRRSPRSSGRRSASSGARAVAPPTSAAGASDAVLVFEERAVLAATRAAANRLANADHANLVRTSRAAHAQLRALRRLDLDALPPKLREIADLRLRHPTLSLRELALR